MKKVLSSLLLLLSFHAQLSAQNVTTYSQSTPDDGIAVDKEGNIYCSHYVGDAVIKYSTTGEASRFVSGLNTPNGIAFNSNEELYVCDGQGNKIYVFDSNGIELSVYSNPGHPSGIIKAYDSETMIFTEYTNNTINTITPDGTITEISSDPLLSGPVGLAYSETNELYVGNYNDRKVYKVDGNGSLTYVATIGNSSNLGFISYGNGSIWGTVLGEHKIYKVNPNSIDDVEVFAGSNAGAKDGPINDATFNQPNGIYFDSDKNSLYVTDFGTKNLRIIDLGETTSTLDSKKLGTISISPNPFDNEFGVRLPNESILPCEIEIFNSEGISVKKEKLHTLSHNFDTKNWSSGNYFIKLTSERYSETKMVIKK
ncbi:MAG: T9SS type A sorting domain-containing protein [Bacteroidota bacterium]